MPVSKAKAGLISVIAFLAGALLSLPILGRYGAFDPIPYRVTDVSWRRDGDFVRVAVDFIKDQCVWKRAVVWGTAFGKVDPRPIPWRNVPGNIGNRTEGRHSVDLEVGPILHEYEALEMRTQHDCDGELITRVLFRIDLQ